MKRHHAVTKVRMETNRSAVTTGKLKNLPKTSIYILLIFEQPPPYARNIYAFIMWVVNVFFFVYPRPSRLYRDPPLDTKRKRKHAQSQDNKIKHMPDTYIVQGSTHHPCRGTHADLAHAAHCWKVMVHTGSLIGPFFSCFCSGAEPLA